MEKKPKTTVALDPELSATIKALKEHNKNVRFIITTRTSKQDRELVEQKLKNCGFNTTDFDIIQTAETKGRSSTSSTAINKPDGLLVAFDELQQKDGWVPEKIMFFDDSKTHLERVKDVIPRINEKYNSKVKYEAYQTHADKHFTHLIRSKIPEIKTKGLAEKAKYQLTEKAINRRLRA